MVLYRQFFFVPADLPSVVLALICLNDFLCPPQVLSSAGVKRSLAGTAINPLKILYRLVSLKFFLTILQLNNKNLVRCLLL